jgi:hypothetical protein
VALEVAGLEAEPAGWAGAAGDAAVVVEAFLPPCPNANEAGSKIKAANCSNPRSVIIIALQSEVTETKNVGARRNLLNLTRGVKRIVVRLRLGKLNHLPMQDVERRSIYHSVNHSASTLIHTSEFNASVLRQQGLALIECIGDLSSIEACDADWFRIADDSAV